VSASLSPEQRALREERGRCRSLVLKVINDINSGVFPQGPYEQSTVLVTLGLLERWIRVGKKLTRPRRPNNQRVCSYCDGEDGPPGHYRSTCPKRIADAAEELLRQRENAA
jgi:hypothetical protein